MKIKIGILGLGHIGYYHIKALNSISEYKLCAACDHNIINKKLLPKNTTFYENTDSFFNDQSYDTVIIATPNRTHVRLACKALEDGKNVILEKPAATTIKEYSKLQKCVKNKKNQHIYYAFHAAKAPEVSWFKKQIQQDGCLNHLGPVNSFICNFYDPYYKNCTFLPESESLQDPWMDSGVNALSVLQQIIGLETFQCLHYTETIIKKNKPAIQANAQYVFGNKSTPYNGVGTINTNWALNLNLKITYLSFSESSTAIELNHSNQFIRRIDKNSNKIIKNFSNFGERLFNHYTGVFRDYIQCLKRKRFNSKDSKLIHHHLFNPKDDILQNKNITDETRTKDYKNLFN